MRVRDLSRFALVVVIAGVAHFGAVSSAAPSKYVPAAHAKCRTGYVKKTLTVRDISRTVRKVYCVLEPKPAPAVSGTPVVTNPVTPVTPTGTIALAAVTPVTPVTTPAVTPDPTSTTTTEPTTTLAPSTTVTLQATTASWYKGTSVVELTAQVTDQNGNVITPAAGSLAFTISVSDDLSGLPYVEGSATFPTRISTDECQFVLEDVGSQLYAATSTIPSEPECMLNDDESGKIDDRAPCGTDCTTAPLESSGQVSATFSQSGYPSSSSAPMTISWPAPTGASPT